MLDLILVYWTAMLNAFAEYHQSIATPSVDSCLFKAAGNRHSHNTPGKTCTRKEREKKGLGGCKCLPPTSLQGHEDY